MKTCTTTFAVAALLAAISVSACGDGPTEIKKPPPPPPPAPVITADATNPTQWFVSSVQTMKFTVSPSTSSCAWSHDNTEPLVGSAQNRTVIQSTTNSGITVAVQNSISKGKPNLKVSGSCTNGSSAPTVHVFDYPLVSAQLVIAGQPTVVRTVEQFGVVYRVTFTGSGFSTYNGDPNFSYTGTMCGFDGRAPAGTEWKSNTELVQYSSGPPNYNWAGTHTYRCVNPDPNGSDFSGTFTVP